MKPLKLNIKFVGSTTSYNQLTAPRIIMTSIHNARILRFLVMLAAVVLLIFIYASYSSNTSMAPPHMRASAVLEQQSSVALLSSQLQQYRTNRSDEIYPSLEGTNKMHEDNSQIDNKNNAAASFHTNSIQAHGSSKTKVVSAGKTIAKKIHREPTIALDAGGGGAGGTGMEEVPDDIVLERLNNNDLLEEQYVQNVDNSIGNIINNSATSGGVQAPSQTEQQQQKPRGAQQQPNAQVELQQQLKSANQIGDKILESEVLIPTSNLQKFIENADKILKNITAVSPAAGGAAPINITIAAINNKTPEKPKEEGPPIIKPQSPNDALNEVDTDINDSDEALPPSVIMTIKQKNSLMVDVQPPPVLTTKANNPMPRPPEVKLNTTKAALDTTKGIPTMDLYEKGHMNEELNMQKICPKGGEDLKLLILITSAQSHAEARLAIRQTWAHYGTRRDVSTGFILGRSTNETLNTALTQENFIYGDLIRGHFIDSYNNLTLKTISSLEWVDENCPRARYILKTDDDMFINVPKLLAFLDSHSKEKRVIYGRLAKKWKPIRNKKSKYYVSISQFSAPVFPPFTTGPAYVLTSDIVHELYVRSLHQVYFKLEDVFTTGIVAQQLGIKRVHVNEFLNRRIAFNPCNIRKTISVHMIKANEQFDLWKKLLDQNTKCK